MKCKECGAILSENALFCSQCGSKVEQTNNEPLDIVLCSGQQFTLFNETVVISQGAKNLIDIYYEFLNMADKKANELRISYQKKMNNEYFMTDIFEVGTNMLQDVIFTVCRHLVEHEVSDSVEEAEEIFNQSFLSIIEKTYMPPFMNMFNEAYEIAQNAGITLATRQLKHDTRGRWSGGGFGLAGALKGAAMAGGLNMVSSAAHSVTKGVANTITRARAMSKIKKVYKSYENDIINGLKQCIHKLGDYYLDLLDQLSGLELERYPASVRRKFENTYNNLVQEGISDKNLKAFVDNIQLYPIDARSYKALLKAMGDSKREIEKICKYLNIDIVYEKKRLLNDYIKFTSGKFSSLENFTSFLQNLYNEGIKYGYPTKELMEETINDFVHKYEYPSDESELLKNIDFIKAFEFQSNFRVSPIIQELEKYYQSVYENNRSVQDILIEVDNEKNTFKLKDGETKILEDIQVVQECREKVKKLREAYEACDKDCSDSLKNLLIDATRLKDTYGLCEQMIPGLQLRWEQADLKERTVNGIVFETRADATIEKSKYYNGKKYDSPQEAQRNEREYNLILNKFSSCNTTLEKYNTYMKLMQETFYTDSAIQLLEERREGINREYRTLQKTKLDGASVLGNIIKAIFNLGLALILTMMGIFFVLRAAIIVKIIATFIVVWSWKRVPESIDEIKFEFRYADSCKRQLNDIYSTLHPVSKEYLIPDSMSYRNIMANREVVNADLRVIKMDV